MVEQRGAPPPTKLTTSTVSPSLMTTESYTARFTMMRLCSTATCLGSRSSWVRSVAIVSGPASWNGSPLNVIVKTLRVLQDLRWALDLRALVATHRTVQEVTEDVRFHPLEGGRGVLPVALLTARRSGLA